MTCLARPGACATFVAFFSIAQTESNTLLLQVTESDMIRDSKDDDRIAEALAEADVEARAAATTSGGVDPESGERLDVLQARLDAELLEADDVLSEQERSISMLAASLTQELLKEIAESRRMAFTQIPSRLEQVFSMSIDHGISGSFLRTVRAAKALAANASVSLDRWKEEMQTRLTDEVDVMIDVYDELREGINQVLHASKRSEEEIIQRGVSQIRQRSLEALTKFHDIMEKAEFQRTVYENQGWDTIMKRSGRMFREEVRNKTMQVLSLSGEPHDSPTAPDLQTEQKALLTSVVELFKRAEAAFSQLTAMIREHPSTVQDKAQYASLLVLMHNNLDGLAEFCRETLVNSTLRLRDDIVRTRLALGMPSLPDDGLLRDVASMPSLLERRDASRISTPASTSTNEDGQNMATILPVGDIPPAVVDGQAFLSSAMRADVANATSEATSKDASATTPSSSLSRHVTSSVFSPMSSTLLSSSIDIDTAPTPPSPLTTSMASGLTTRKLSGSTNSIEFVPRSTESISSTIQTSSLTSRLTERNSSATASLTESHMPSSAATLPKKTLDVSSLSQTTQTVPTSESSKVTTNAARMESNKSTIETLSIESKEATPTPESASSISVTPESRHTSTAAPTPESAQSISVTSGSSNVTSATSAPESVQSISVLPETSNVTSSTTTPTSSKSAPVSTSETNHTSFATTSSLPLTATTLFASVVNSTLSSMSPTLSTSSETTSSPMTSVYNTMSPAVSTSDSLQPESSSETSQTAHSLSSSPKNTMVRGVRPGPRVSRSNTTSHLSHDEL